MVIHCILTGLAVYYIALWLWYRHTDSRNSEKGISDKPVSDSQANSYTLIGESRYKGGQIGTAQDKSGHLPQAAGNDTIFAPQTNSRKKAFRMQHPKRTKRPVTRMTNPTTRTRK